jgi:hypothetical protein
MTSATATAKSVVAELMEEHVGLKKELGGL